MKDLTYTGRNQISLRRKIQVIFMVFFIGEYYSTLDCVLWLLVGTNYRSAFGLGFGHIILQQVDMILRPKTWTRSVAL